MIILNNEIKLQISDLSRRTIDYKKKLKGTIKLALLTGAASIAFFLLRSLFNIELSEIDIPSSLISSSGGKFGSLNNVTAGINSVISILKYLGLLGIPLFIIMVIKNGAGALSLGIPTVFFLILSFTGSSSIEEPNSSYNNDIMQKIVNYPSDESLTTEYIDKLNKVDERYVLAQAAILSNSNFPASFFKSVATDIKNNGKFIPTDEAIYSIELSAYGFPQTPRIVERAEQLATYRSILDLAAHASMGSFFSLFLFGTFLAILLLSISNRLEKINSLINTVKNEQGTQ
ncbi:hypothetical protein ACRZOU_004114 [Aeromonas salmonicida]